MFPYLGAGLAEGNWVGICPTACFMHGVLYSMAKRRLAFYAEMFDPC